MPLQTRENNVHFQLHRVLTVKPTGSLSKVTHYPASLQPWWYSWQPETATHVSVDIVQIKNTRRGWGLPGRDALCKQPRLKTQHSWHPPPDKNDSTDEDKKSQNYLWSQISFVPISPWEWQACLYEGDKVTDRSLWDNQETSTWRMLTYWRQGQGRWERGESSLHERARVTWTCRCGGAGVWASQCCHRSKAMSKPLISHPSLDSPKIHPEKAEANFLWNEKLHLSA